ncbi:acyl-CoA desaturase [Rubripirellula amarantea]|uniref:Fatty acid desaturase n=1 Tax=Rubripirellula amarantea TaxID=2527999 RepID=A0A5C5WGF5_9BACT|nr:acyl-CoA desaturase [Rubripirellula amarantea]MDA8745365.1 acyl-CoA desaturase [Rubripirellula amarantea]TWT49191.1 Fatty acid desaturase [Rubripirellula amarantea]
MSSVADPKTTEKNKTRPSAHARPQSDFDNNVEIWDKSNIDDSDLENTLLDDAKSNAKKPKPQSETAQDRVRLNNLSYWAIGWLAAAHIVVLTMAYPYFSWTGLAVMVGLHWVTGSLGICLGFHRLLTHTGMQTYPWVRNVFATIGTLAGEGSPLDWVADHRKHHALSDQEGDPHSPHDGGFWSHAFWLAFHTHNGDRVGYLKRWAPDLYKERYMRALDYLFLPLHALTGLILFGIGYAIDGAAFGTSLLVWGLFVRLVLVLHATWLVNSASHMFGYRNYETTDDSRNNWFVAIVAYGEGWHNNHHAYPRMAKHGHKWWEFDITWQAIKLLKATGLAWDVVDYKNAAEKRKKLAEQAA